MLNKVSKGFTVMELVFVIIVISILSSIVFTKIQIVKQYIYEALMSSFVGTLNRTVGPSLWIESMQSGKKGDISYIKSLKNYIDIPKEINGSDISLKECNDSKKYHTIAKTNSYFTVYVYDIQCKNGTFYNAPYFRLIREVDGKVIATRQ